MPARTELVSPPFPHTTPARPRPVPSISLWSPSLAVMMVGLARTKGTAWTVGALGTHESSRLRGLLPTLTAFSPGPAPQSCHRAQGQCDGNSQRGREGTRKITSSSEVEGRLLPSPGSLVPQAGTRGSRPNAESGTRPQRERH